MMIQKLLARSRSRSGDGRQALPGGQGLEEQGFLGKLEVEPGAGDVGEMRTWIEDANEFELDLEDTEQAELGLDDPAEAELGLKDAE